MSIQTDPRPYVDAAKAAYQAKEYPSAASAFATAAELYLHGGDQAAAAEMANNQSVALLQAGDAQGAFRCANGTDAIFAEIGDTGRQAIAIGNQAAALEQLGDLKKAEQLYTRCADLFKLSGDLEKRKITLQTISALQLKQRHQLEAMASMNSALQLEEHLSPREVLLKKLIHTVFGFLQR
jgi:tetratricopeptide (TPR) repeat protein